MKRGLGPTQLYLLISFGMAFAFSLMSFISGIYRVQTAQLDPFQLLLLGTALEGSTFLFEVPTGIVADLYSRRLSVIIGYFVIGLGFLLEGLFPTFIVIFLAQAVWGLGYTFISGAQDAWLADEIGEEKLTSVYVQAGQYGRIGGILGLIASAGIGLLNLALPIVISGGLFMALALFLVLVMPETGFTPTEASERNTFHKMRDTFTNGLGHVRRRPSLRLIMWIGLFFGLYAEGADRLTEAHILDGYTFPFSWDPVVWFFLMSIAISIVGYLVNEIIRRRIDVDDLRRSLTLQFTVNALLMGAITLFALAPGFAFVYSSAVIMHVLRGTSRPYYHAWLNSQLKDSTTRATILSMNGQVDAIGQLVGGLVIGAMGRLVSLPAGLLTMLIFLGPAVWLFSVARRQNHQLQEAAA
ncbi:MAG: MFS transporter [Ardenticatenales bacterium]|nr:MFS transporter [Ardenticatenales bacterium]